MPLKLGRSRLVAMLLVSGIYDLFAVDRSGARAQFNKSMMWAYSGVKSLSVDERFKLMSSVRTPRSRSFCTRETACGASGSAFPLEI
jgi:hypothetical protein